LFFVRQPYDDLANLKSAKTDELMRTDLEARPCAKDTILLGGLAIGVLDFFDASLFFGLYSGAPFQRIWQGVASGLLGPRLRRAGGWNTALLGIGLHFVVAFCIATVYYFACEKHFIPSPSSHHLGIDLLACSRTSS
jgi:hypothetical protein